MTRSFEHKNFRVEQQFFEQIIFMKRTLIEKKMAFQIVDISIELLINESFTSYYDIN